MAHKVEIENIYNAVNEAWDESNHLLYHNLGKEIYKFRSFVDGACVDCADDNGIIIKREVFASKLDSINEAINAINSYMEELKSCLPVLDDYWPVDIADTTGLTNPTTETTETTETTDTSATSGV